MGTLKTTTQQQVETEVYFAPCIECGDEDITFYNCGYSTFNVGGAKCKKCGNEVKVNGLDSNASNAVLIPHWNQKNDPAVLIEKYQKEIEELQQKINKLNGNR